MTQHTVAIYARVSTDDTEEDAKGNKTKTQDPENQLRPLREWCERGGHQIVEEYVERVSGRKGAADRKELSRLFADAHKRKFTLVLFWSLDRFSREGMTQTVLHLERHNSYGVAFHSYTEEFLSTDNELVRDILLSTLARLAKLDAQKISSRTKAGLARARAQGKILGRPAMDVQTIERIKKERLKHPELSLRALAKELRLPYPTVRKYAR